MENYEVTVKFGIGNGRIVNVPAGTTIGQVVDSTETRAALGYNPSNVRILIGRVPQDRNARVANGDVIELETAGTSKAS